MAMLAVTMGVANATSPILQPSTSVPADNATGVATNTNIVLTFDVALYNRSPSNPIVELYNSSNTLIESFIATGPATMIGSNGGSGSITLNQITLVLGAPLTNGTTYHIVIPATTELYDVGSSNRAVAVTDATTYNFTVGSPPPTNAPIDLHFSKQVETYSTDIELK